MALNFEFDKLVGGVLLRIFADWGFSFPSNSCSGVSYDLKFEDFIKKMQEKVLDIQAEQEEKRNLKGEKGYLKIKFLDLNTGSQKFATKY